VGLGFKKRPLIIRSAVSIQSSQTNKISGPLEIAAQETRFHDTRALEHTHTPHHHQGNEMLKVLPYFSSPTSSSRDKHLSEKHSRNFKNWHLRPETKKSNPQKSARNVSLEKRKKFRICQASVNQ
jgi:hypothetical protein